MKLKTLLQTLTSSIKVNILAAKQRCHEEIKIQQTDSAKSFDRKSLNGACNNHASHPVQSSRSGASLATQYWVIPGNTQSRVTEGLARAVSVGFQPWGVLCYWIGVQPWGVLCYWIGVQPWGVLCYLTGFQPWECFATGLGSSPGSVLLLDWGPALGVFCYWTGVQPWAVLCYWIGPVWDLNRKNSAGIFLPLQFTLQHE